jgi:hypothetical protein
MRRPGLLASKTVLCVGGAVQASAYRVEDPTEGEGGLRRRFLAALAGSVLVLAVAVSAASADVRVSGGQPYVRYDGGTDSAIATCGDRTSPTGGGKQGRVEPSVAIDPQDTSLIVAAANDFCASPVTGDAWEGVYTSRNGGATWTDSLLPGYPGDTSAGGTSSPLFGTDTVASDPILDWDNANRLFVGGVAFNRTATTGRTVLTNADVYVATYTRDPAAPLGIAYARTVVVGQGTPSAFGEGLFNDKPSLKVDSWPLSRFGGNVYVAWTLFTGPLLGNRILFSRSTDAGQTFSKPVIVSKNTPHAQGSDIAVAPNGDVYVFWRQFAFVNGQPDAIGFVKSCLSGFTFHRWETLPQATADASGALYVTWEQVEPVPSDGNSYRPDGQSQVVLAKSTTGGATWSAAAPVDPGPVGHQFAPNIEYDKATNTLALIYYDSREDASYSPYRPPGVQADGTSICGAPVGASICDVLNAFVATSTDGASSWTRKEVSTVGNQPEYEMYFSRRVPFHGDYIWIDADGGKIFGVWTDNRDVVPGIDPREIPGDGFDVHQCRTQNADGSWSADTCPNAGGLDQNIYGG